jgi:hypothetical protein
MTSQFKGIPNLWKTRIRGLRTIRKHFLKITALVAVAILNQGSSGSGLGFGGSDEGYDPGCTTDGSPVPLGLYGHCLSTRVIGRSDDALIWTVPYTEPLEQDNVRIVMPIVSLKLDGTSEVIEELDYLSESLASNGVITAAVGPDFHSIIVHDRNTQESWVAYELLDVERIERMDIVGEHLAIQLSDGNRIYGVVIDLLSHQQVLSLYPAFYWHWALAEDWLMTGYLFEDYTIAIQLHSLRDDRVIEVAHAADPATVIMDNATNAVYWTEIIEYPYVLDLMRWDFSTGEIIVEDSQFSQRDDSRGLSDAYQDDVAGTHDQNGQHALFIRQRNGPENETIAPFPDYYPNTNEPIIIQKKLVWLEDTQQKVKIFDPESKLVSEIDYPSN